jgi:hypothetical protein
MKLIDVEPSKRAGKKWVATFEDDEGRTKQTHFGSKGMNDFTLTGDKDARDRYWIRHKKDLRTGDPTRAGFLSLFLLWNKPTLEASVKDYIKRFKL